MHGLQLIEPQVIYFPVTNDYEMSLPVHFLEVFAIFFLMFPDQMDTKGQPVA